MIVLTSEEGHVHNKNGFKIIPLKRLKDRKVA